MQWQICQRTQNKKFKKIFYNFLPNLNSFFYYFSFAPLGLRRLFLNKFCRFLFFTLTLSSLAHAIDYPLSEWKLTSYENAVASIHAETIFVLNGGTDFWHVQLTRQNVELQNGKTYEAKFTLRSEDKSRRIEVRIGRDGFPYDAFAEFGEIAVTTTNKFFTRTFSVQSGNAENARFEFNLGKHNGAIHISEVSLKCLDCDENFAVSDKPFDQTDWNFVIIADSVDIRDNSMALGNISGTNLELGAHSKIFGDAEIAGKCFLREFSSITGTLYHPKTCSQQKMLTTKQILSRTINGTASTLEIAIGQNISKSIFNASPIKEDS